MESLDRRSVLLGLGVLGITAGLQGCSGDSPTQRATAPASGTPSAVAGPAVNRWPLTGRPLAAGADPGHAAVAVKVPDNEREHPQVGLDVADVVFVQLDGYRDASGYSSTRLMPVFHSRLPAGTAPVRSMRPVDVPLLAPIGAVIGSTGATGWVLAYVEEHGALLDGSQTYLATKGTGCYSIDRDRVRRYQGVTYYDRAVVCHPKVLSQRAKRFRAGPQQPYFPFAANDSEVSTAAGRSARTISVPWKKGHSYDMGYRFDEASGRYLRSMPWGKHVLADGTRVATDNVLVVRAGQRFAKIFAGKGGPEPIHEIVDGSGTFVYAHGGRSVSGRWTKAAVDAAFVFTLDDGSPLRMAPGQTFVELPRADADVRLA